jgi:hypothetical protein
MKVGNRKILFSETLFVQNGETAEIEQEITEGEILKLRLLFPQDVEHEGKKNPIILYQTVGDWFELRFVNFTESLGATTNNPYVFATSSKGAAISYMAVVYKLPTHSKIELQVMMEILP